jgi:hypothetical protein
MNKTLLTLTLIATFTFFAAPQDGKAVPPLTARENPQIVSTESSAAPAMTKDRRQGER